MHIRSLGRSSVVLALVLGGGLVFAAPQMPCGSVTEYRSLLDRIEQQSLDVTASLIGLADGIPDQCDFSIGGQTFHVSNSALKSQISFAAAKTAPDELGSALQQLHKSVQCRIEGLETYTAPIDPTLPAKLNGIFAQKEFRNVGKQDVSTILQELIIQWLARLLSDLVKDPGRLEFVAKVILWSVCALAVVLILWLLYRWAARASPQFPARQPMPFAPSAKHWRDWLSEARSAVERGELREAIHAAYWAAISHLESSGAWRPDLARTPREYLRLLSQENQSRNLLVAITKDFEITWYGNHTPALSQWEAFLSKVEQIGCR